MNMNREVAYSWKSQVLLLIGALLINVMLVSGAKAENTESKSADEGDLIKEMYLATTVNIGDVKAEKIEKDIEKQPYRMVDLGDAKFLSTEDILAIEVEYRKTRAIFNIPCCKKIGRDKSSRTQNV